jgi:hypothetical protein
MQFGVLDGLGGQLGGPGRTAGGKQDEDRQEAGERHGRMSGGENLPYRAFPVAYGAQARPQTCAAQSRTSLHRLYT